MSARVTAVHYWRSSSGVLGGRTLCGIQSSRRDEHDSEACTEQGYLVEIVGGINKKATCKRCVKLAPAGLAGSHNEATEP